VPPRSPPHPPAVVRPPSPLHPPALARSYRAATARLPYSTSAIAVCPAGGAYQSKRGSPVPPSSHAGLATSSPSTPPAHSC
jgi:hypothetical protein